MEASLSTPVAALMSTSLVAVRPDASLKDVLATLRQHDVSCVVVTDEAGALRGIVSMTDLARVAEVALGGPGEPVALHAPARTAGEIMRTEVVTVGEDDPVREAARRMVEFRIHRVVVTRDGRAAGVFSARDVMRVVRGLGLVTPLSEVMTSPVQTVEVGDSIETALARLGDADVRGLVVVDGEFPIGVFTQAEAIAARTLPRELRANPVERVMSYECTCLDVTTPLHRAAAHAFATRSRRIVVVELGRLRGIVTGLDLARVAIEAG